MTAISFETPDELADYVTTGVIPNSDIAQIIEKDGRWHLFHY
jgi:hypothetical protein